MSIGKKNGVRAKCHAQETYADSIIESKKFKRYLCSTCVQWSFLPSCIQTYNHLIV